MGFLQVVIVGKVRCAQLFLTHHVMKLDQVVFQVLSFQLQKSVRKEPGGAEASRLLRPLVVLRGAQGFAL